MMASLRRVLFTLLLAVGLAGLGATPGCAQQTQQTEPDGEASTSQSEATSSIVDTIDSDVPYVPTPQPVVDRMLEMAQVDSEDVVYDLGSGDGRIVITAAEKYGARGVGIEIDPERIAEARKNAEEAGVTDLVEFRRQDLFQTDLRPATVVTLYLLPSVNLKLRPRLLKQLEPGTPVVSHDFDMGEWEPEEEVEMGTDTIYLWHIPEEIPERLLDTES